MYALSDKSGKIDYDIRPAIMNASEPAGLFTEDMVEFATETADRMRSDHEMVREDHARGAFTHDEFIQKDAADQFAKMTMSVLY